MVFGGCQIRTFHKLMGLEHFGLWLCQGQFAGPILEDESTLANRSLRAPFDLGSLLILGGSRKG